MNAKLLGVLALSLYCIAAPSRSAIAQFDATTLPGVLQQGTEARVGDSQSMTGAAKRAANAPLGLDGFCPVCIIDMKQWVKGEPEFAVLMDGKKYLFPGEEQKQKFLKNTTKYTPALGGDCIVCFATDGSRVPGKLNVATLHEGRLFLFPTEEEKAIFMKDPAKFENADLALGGNCAVCRIEMQKEVAGKAEFGTIAAGMRYYFPSQEQRMMFLKNKPKYLVPTKQP